jgi:transposase-like protein
MEVTKKKDREEQGQEGKKPGIDPAIIEELMKGYQRPEDLTGPGGIMEQLTEGLYERVLGAEMTHYLGYEKGHAPKLEADQENRGHFPSDEAATKLIYLALRNITKNWENPPVTWKLAATQFAIQRLGQRYTLFTPGPARADRFWRRSHPAPADVVRTTLLRVRKQSQ